MESHFWFYIESKRWLQFFCVTAWRMEIRAHICWGILWITRSCFSLSSKIWRNFIRWVVIRVTAWWWWINGIWIWYWLNISSKINWRTNKISESRFFSKRTHNVILRRFLSRFLQLKSRRSILNSLWSK